MGSRTKLTPEERQERDDYEALLKTMYHKVRLIDSKSLFFAANNAGMEQLVSWDVYFMKKQIFADKYIREIFNTRTFVFIYYTDVPMLAKNSVATLAVLSKRTGEIKYTTEILDMGFTTRYSTAYGTVSLMLCRKRSNGKLNQHVLLILDNTSDRIINTLNVHGLGYTTPNRANLEIEEYVDGIGVITRKAIIFPEKTSRDDKNKPGYLGTTFNNKESLFLRMEKSLEEALRQ